MPARRSRSRSGIRVTRSPLTASIAILIPNGATSWTATPVTYTASTGTNNTGRADGGGGRPNCNANSRTDRRHGRDLDVRALAAPTTTGNFNGCWLVIQARHPRQLPGPRRGLVEDQVHDDRQRRLERRHDLEGPDPRQPGPPHRQLTRGGAAAPPLAELPRRAVFRSVIHLRLSERGQVRLCANSYLAERARRGFHYSAECGLRGGRLGPDVERMKSA